VSMTPNPNLIESTGPNSEKVSYDRRIFDGWSPSTDAEAEEVFHDHTIIDGLCR
jgi:hypothetical protein